MSAPANFERYQDMMDAIGTFECKHCKKKIKARLKDGDTMDSILYRINAKEDVTAKPKICLVCPKCSMDNSFVISHDLVDGLWDVLLWAKYGKDIEYYDNSPITKFFEYMEKWEQRSLLLGTLAWAFVTLAGLMTVMTFAITIATVIETFL